MDAPTRSQKRTPVWQRNRLSRIGDQAITCLKWVAGFNGAVWNPFRAAARFFLVAFAVLAIGFLSLSAFYIKANLELFQVSPLDVVKVIGAFAAAAFGLYGIGAKTRSENGSLNRAGWTAALGIVTGLVLSAAAQLMEASKRTADAKADTMRYEQLVKSSLSAFLTTKDARITMDLTVSMADLTAVDPRYGKRLQTAFDRRGKCQQSFRRFGVLSFSVWQCGDYLIEEDPLDDNAESLTFDWHSVLRPADDLEPLAETLIRLMGVSLQIRDPNQISTPWTIRFFSMQPFLEQARFKLRGKEGQIEVRIQNLMIDQTALEDANFTSIVDLVGNDVLLSTSGVPRRCPGDDLHCEQFRRVLGEAVDLNEFSIRLPHRRDLVFNPLNRYLYREEKRDVKHPQRFIRRMPNSISDFPITDRQSLGGR